MTNLIFEYVSRGDIPSLKKNLQQLGFKSPSDIAFLHDEETYKQNALFFSCCIKDDEKAMAMTKFLIEECKCNPTL